MNCNNCGAKLYKNAKFCAVCGSKVEEIKEETINPETIETLITEVKTEITPVVPTIEETKPIEEPKKVEEAKKCSESKFSSKAITGFVLALSGSNLCNIYNTYFFNFVCGVIGLIFSILAIRDVKTKNYRGKGIAIAGLVVSITIISICIIYAVLEFLYYTSLYFYI